MRGANPETVIREMPKEDFEKIENFIANINSYNFPRNQRRMIERKWDKIYGNKRNIHKKI